LMPTRWTSQPRRLTESHTWGARTRSGGDGGDDGSREQDDHPKPTPPRCRTVVVFAPPRLETVPELPVVASLLFPVTGAFGFEFCFVHCSYRYWGVYE